MKITRCLAGVALMVLLAGCANPTARGGAGGGPELRAYSGSQAFEVGEYQPQDYRRILSDPGPF